MSRSRPCPWAGKMSHYALDCPVCQKDARIKELEERLKLAEAVCRSLLLNNRETSLHTQATLEAWKESKKRRKRLE